MDETIFANNWKELKGKVKERWHSLTDEDLIAIDGSREVLVSMLQEKYYYSKEKAEEEVNRFLKEFAPAI